MKCTRLLVGALACWLAGTAAYAAAPDTLSYQGRLTQSGTAVTGQVSVTFSLYSAATGGTALWSETQSVAVASGLYSAILGKATAFPAGLFTQGLYIGVKVGADPEMNPRQELTSTAYSQQAKRADVASSVDPGSSSLVSNYFLNGGNSFGNVAVIGTNDNNTLEVAVNRTRVMRYVPNDTSPNIIGGYYGNGIQPNTLGATVAGGGHFATDCLDPDLQTATKSCANVASSSYATVSGGTGNTSFGDWATVGGGISNAAAGQASTVSGGKNNYASFLSVVGGGMSNVTSGGYNTISGGTFNKTSNVFSTVSGGTGHTASGNASTISGGNTNTASDSYSTVSGGQNNLASGLYGTVSGGLNNVASFQNTTVSGGGGNQATGDSSTISGGLVNTASGNYSVVSGGHLNTASGSGSTVAGGSDNSASGPGSFAAGRQASATHETSFVWNGYPATPQSSLGPGRVHFYSPGGFTVFTTNPGGGIDCNKATPGAQCWVHINNDTQQISTSSGGYLSASGIWTNGSDRTSKTDFQTIDAQDVLARVVAMPVTQWRYKSEGTGVAHIGPVAQDFFAAFKLGTDDKAIGTVDESGVSLAAIQGLNQKVDTRDAALHAVLADKDAQIASQAQRISELEARVASTETLQAEVITLRTSLDDLTLLKATVAQLLRERNGPTMTGLKMSD